MDTVHNFKAVHGKHLVQCMKSAITIINRFIASHLGNGLYVVAS